MGRIREDARVLEAGAEVEEQHPVALDRRQPQLDFRPPQQRPDLLLERPELLAGDDRLFVDQVPLDGRQHLLLGDLKGADDREAADHELLGRQQCHQGGGIRDLRAQALAHLGRQHRRLAHHVHLQEAAVEQQLEVAVEPCLRVRHDGDPRVIDTDIQAVHAAQDEGVRLHDAHVGKQGRVDVDSPSEHPVRPGQVAREGRRGIEGLEPEGQQGSGVALLVEGRRDDGDHESPHQLQVGPEGGRIEDLGA
jgi:hypothetical protein